MSVGPGGHVDLSVVLLGGSATGTKSSLVHWFMTGKPLDIYDPSILEEHRKDVELNGRCYHLTIVGLFSLAYFDFACLLIFA